MVGVASVSAFLSLPGFAQMSPNSNMKILANRTCGGYEGNATTGGGYACAMLEEKEEFSNSDMNWDNTQSETSRPENNYIDNGGSTTGAGYPGNNVTPQGTPQSQDKSLDQGFTPNSNKAPQSATDFNDFVAPPGGTYNERTGVFYQEDENLVVP